MIALTTSERFTGIFGRASLTTAIIVSIPAYFYFHLMDTHNLLAPVLSATVNIV
jgi:hypothetical protein